MEETFYKRVSVKEELPETPRTKHFTNAGYTTFFNLKEGWSDKSVEWWLKPLPILSREKMIEALVEANGEERFAVCESYKALYVEINYESIADAILKAGLPEKKVEIKKTEHGMSYKCPNCPDKDHIVKYDSNFCPNCGSKITWIS